jgi:hypothetical protein
LRFELDGSLVESTLLEGFFGREPEDKTRARNAAARPARTKRSMD